MYSLTFEELLAIQNQLPNSEQNKTIKSKLQMEIDFVNELQRPIIEREQLRLQLANRMFTAIEQTYGVTKQQMKGKDRFREFTDLRHAFLTILVQNGISLTDSAKTLNKNHCLAIYSVNSHEIMFENCKDYAEKYTTLKNATEYGN